MNTNNLAPSIGTVAALKLVKTPDGGKALVKAKPAKKPAGKVASVKFVEVSKQPGITTMVFDPSAATAKAAPAKAPKSKSTAASNAALAEASLRQSAKAAPAKAAPAKAAPAAPAKVAAKVAADMTLAELKAANSGPSKVANPVELAWELFNSDPNAKRKDAIVKAVSAGVSYFTATTQYGLWYKAATADA